MEDMDSLRSEQGQLTGERDRLQNDLEYIEKLARERHRMAKPGEKVFRDVERQEGGTDSLKES